jgi:DNA-binding HxlR family transcriptional regulator
MLPKSQLRSECPVSCTLDVIGDRWTLLVIRDLFLGKRYFDEFLASTEGIATNILTARLARLSKMKLVRRVKSQEDGRRVAYELTELGLTLKPLLKEVARWGLKHFHGGAPLPPTAFSPASRPRKKAARARLTAPA